MLESIAINRRFDNNIQQPFSMGHLAECLLFYGKVNIVISTKELEELLRKCNIHTLTSLLSTGVLNIHLSSFSFGATQTPNTNRLSYGTFHKAGSSLAKDLMQTLLKVYRDGYKCQQYAKMLLPYLCEFNSEYGLVEGFLVDNNFTTRAFKEVVKRQFPDYPIPLDLTFHLDKTRKTNVPEELTTEHTFEVSTNFDIQKFENSKTQYKIKAGSNTLITFMMKAAAAIQEIDVAATFKSELSTEEENNPIVQNAILNLDEYQPSNEKVITYFRESIIPDYPSIADSINSGRRSFDDFMELFAKAQQFKKWIHDTPDEADHSIVSEYIKEIEGEAFTDGFFQKALKFVTVSAPVALNPLPLIKNSELITAAANLIVGTAADLFADKVFRKFNHWKPNQFVNTHLKSFVKEDQEP